MTFLLLIVWISTGKKKRWRRLLLLLHITVYLIFKSLFMKLLPLRKISKIETKIWTFLILFFFSWRCSFPRRPQKNDSSFPVTYFSVMGKDRFTFLTTVFQRFGKQLVYFVLQNYHCNKSSCHSLPHIVTIFSLWWGLCTYSLSNFQM